MDGVFIRMVSRTKIFSYPTCINKNSNVLITNTQPGLKKEYDIMPTLKAKAHIPFRQGWLHN